MKYKLILLLWPVFLLYGISVCHAESVGYLKGSAEYYHKAEKRWKSISISQKFSDATRIRTGQDGRVELIFKGSRAIRLSQNTELFLKKTTSNKTGGLVDGNLLKGRIWGSVFRKSTKTGRMLIRTPIAIIGVRGTQFDVLLKEKQKSLKVTVLKGRVEISPPVEIDGPVEIEAPFEVESPHEINQEEWLMGVQSKQQLTVTAGELPVLSEAESAFFTDEWIHFNQKRDQELRTDSNIE